MSLRSTATAAAAAAAPTTAFLTARRMRRTSYPSPGQLFAANEPAQRARRRRADHGHAQHALRRSGQRPQRLLAQAIARGELVKKRRRGAAFRARIAGG